MNDSKKAPCKFVQLSFATAFREFVNKGEHRQISGEVFSLPFSFGHFLACLQAILSMKRGWAAIESATI
jgi:hypothetical protein